MVAWVFKFLPQQFQKNGVTEGRVLPAAELQQQEEDGHIFIICCPDARTLTADLESIDFCAIKFLYWNVGLGEK